MNEDVFNMSLRKFLKKVGVTGQRAIEEAVRDAVAKGKLKGSEKLPAEMTLTLGGTGAEAGDRRGDRAGLGPLDLGYGDSCRARHAVYASSAAKGRDPGAATGRGFATRHAGRTGFRRADGHGNDAPPATLPSHAVIHRFRGNDEEKIATPPPPHAPAPARPSPRRT